MEERLGAALGIDTVFTMDGLTIAYFPNLSGSDNYTEMTENLDQWIAAMAACKQLQTEQVDCRVLYCSVSILGSEFGLDEYRIGEQLGYGDSSITYVTNLFVVAGDSNRVKKRRPDKE